jgi:hypothetical protein
VAEKVIHDQKWLGNKLTLAVFYAISSEMVKLICCDDAIET